VKCEKQFIAKKDHVFYCRDNSQLAEIIAAISEERKYELRQLIMGKYSAKKRPNREFFIRQLKMNYFDHRRKQRNQFGIPMVFGLG